MFEGGAGDDSLAGGLGADTYRFAGENLGTDTVTEADPAGPVGGEAVPAAAGGPNTDTLDFAGVLGGVVIDLESAAKQGADGAGVGVCWRAAAIWVSSLSPPGPMRIWAASRARASARS